MRGGGERKREMEWDVWNSGCKSLDERNQTPHVVMKTVGWLITSSCPKNPLTHIPGCQKTTPPKRITHKKKLDSSERCRFIPRYLLTLLSTLHAFTGNVIGYSFECASWLQHCDWLWSWGVEGLESLTFQYHYRPTPTCGNQCSRRKSDSFCVISPTAGTPHSLKSSFFRGDNCKTLPRLPYS